MRLYIALLFIFIQINAQSGIISGFISDSSSAEALIGANVIPVSYTHLTLPTTEAV